LTGCSGDATPLPAALVDRRIRSVLCRGRQRRQKLAYVYFEEAWPALGGQAAHEGQARRIAANIAKLPELLGKPK
jgi:hypothetical protein